MARNNDSGHFMTCAHFEKFMEYPVHCSFEQLLRNKVAELNCEAGGEMVSAVSEEARRNMEDVPVSHEKKKSEYETTSNNKCVRMMRPDGYYVMLKPKIPYPRPSFLTHFQQAQYYVLKQKVANQQLLMGSAASSGPDASALEELHALVNSEQKDYMQYLRHCFDQLKEDYKYVDISAQKYVQQVLFGRECRLKSSPAYYSILVEHTLPKAEEHVPLMSEKVVLNVGLIPRIVVPIISNQPDKKTRAMCDQANELLQRYPPNPKLSSFTKPIVSYDFNSASLATKHRCDVVLSGSAVTALLYTVDRKFVKDEYIPVMVKEYDVDDNGEFHPHKVVYVNKPYKHYNLTTQDKSHLFHKTGLKHVLQLKTSEHYQPSTNLPRHFHFRNKKTEQQKPRSLEREVQSVDDDLFAASVERLETFGTEMSVKPKQQRMETEIEKVKVKLEVKTERKRPLFGSTSPAKKARASLLDMVNPNSVSTLENEGRRGKRGNPTPRQTVNTALDGIMESQSKLLSNETRKPKEQTVRHELENPGHYVHWRAPKTSSYAVWNLGHLRLLIRTNHHGDVRDASTNKTKPLYLCPKMEYQPTLGAEVLTLEECARTWVNSYIRHKCHVLRARVHAYTSEVLMLEGLEHQKLLPPGCPYQPEAAQTTMHQTLSHLVSLPAGLYLLKCSADSNKIQILNQKPKNTEGVFNFRQFMADCAQKAGESSPRWLPIDTELEMPYHRYCNRVVATFQPADGVHPANFANKKKSKKKKKPDSKGGQSVVHSKPEPVT